ncbi:MAG: hypothetical protein QM811_25350 [Pirellulales bacterium]
MSRKVAYKAHDKVDAELDARFKKMEDNLHKNVVDRLRRLDLAPTVVSLQTTEERVVGRFRLSDADQLGAHTAHPLALSDSLSSVQLHESALNNVLSNLDLTGQTWKIADLHAHLAKKFGGEAKKLPDDMPTDVTIRFADEDALSLHFQDGRLLFTVAIAELTKEDRVWENLELEVAYKLESDGLQLVLRRDGNVSLGGEHKGRTDVMLRAIAGKMFPRDNAVALIPQRVLDDSRLQGLVWSRVQLENGWLGLSISETAELARRSVLKTIR